MSSPTTLLHNLNQPSKFFLSLPRCLFSQIADSVGAVFMFDMAHIAGLVAAKLHQKPCDFAHIVTSTTHKTLRGPRGGIILIKHDFKP